MEQKINYEYNKKNKQINQNTDEEKNKETTELIDDIKKVYQGKKKQKLNGETQENKRLYETINKEQTLKKEAYDYLSKIVGADLYKIENRKEIKKAYKILDNVQKDIENLETILKGKETYKLPTGGTKEFIEYISNIDPKKKGLYFKEQELRDITILFKNKELEHKDHIDTYKEKIEEIEQKTDSENNYTNQTLKELRQEKHNYARLINAHQRRREEINHELDGYICEIKIIQNQICEQQNLLNYTRSLSNNIKFSLNIVGQDFTTEEGKAYTKAMKNMTSLQKLGDKFKTYAEEFVKNKNTKLDNIYKKAEHTIRTDNGEELSDSILAKNKSIFNQSSANMKAMRDTYFEQLGY